MQSFSGSNCMIFVQLVERFWPNGGSVWFRILDEYGMYAANHGCTIGDVKALSIKLKQIVN